MPLQSTELPQTSFAILGMLSFEPMSGYDLKQFADRSISHFYWSPAKSQIYAELRRLRKAGLVTEEHIEQEGRPDKRVYALTDEGQSALSEWVNEADFEQDVFKSNLMLRVFFGKSAETESLLRILGQNLEFTQAKLEELQGMEQQCLAAGPEYDATFSLLTIRGGIHLMKAEIDWTRESMETLEAKLGKPASASGELNRS